jgi:2-dehydro-3-deoxyphosphogluconate aldolase/(4S)-4-hydroxy-2-oxoglutarate aldolase
VINELTQQRALAIVRAPGIADPVGLAATLVAAGLPIMEFPLTTPDATTIIARTSTVDGAIVGAGTVLTPEQAQEVVAAGARFLVTPDVRPAVAEAARRLGVPVALGALTPTEVGAAIDAGATVVKLFPAARLGPAYLRDLHGPFPDVPLLATGGIDAGNAADYLAAGALAVCAGSAVVPPGMAASGDLAGIAVRAEEFVRAVRGGSKERT